MISALLVLLLFFVGASGSGGVIFWRAANCESPLVYCVRERLFTFCVDFKEFTVRWKFHLECLSRSSCFYGGDFPCRRLPNFHQKNESREDVIITATPPSQSPSSPPSRRIGLMKKTLNTRRSSDLVRFDEEARKNARSPPSLVFEGSKTSPKLPPGLHSETIFGKISKVTTISSSKLPSDLHFRSKTGFGKTTTPSSPPHSTTSRTWLKATGTGRASLSIGLSRKSLGNSTSTKSALTDPVLPISSYVRSATSSPSSKISTVNSSEAHPENLKTLTKTTSPSSVFDETALGEVGVPISDDPVLPKSPISISSSTINSSSEVYPENLKTPTTVLMEEHSSSASSDGFSEEQVTMKVSTADLTTTEESKPTPPTACNGTGRYPGPSCDAYYECFVVWWWFEPGLRFCAEGFAFSVANRTCVPTADSDCLN